MLTFPKSESPLSDCLDSIECSIAFDVRDWSEDRRSAWIYGIVFGWDDAEDEIKRKFHWDDNDVKRLHLLHRQWESLKRKNGVRKNEPKNVNLADTSEG